MQTAPESPLNEMVSYPNEIKNRVGHSWAISARRKNTKSVSRSYQYLYTVVLKPSETSKPCRLVF